MNLPSVTQVLGVYQDFSKVPADVLQYAQNRGSLVHKICGCIARGVPYLGEIPPDHAGYVLSFRNWFDTAVEEVVLVEERLYDYDLGYHGKPDLIVRIKGDRFLTLPDLKTPQAVYPVWAAQCAAYRNLARKNDHDVQRQGSLRLDPHGGRAKLTEYMDDTRDMAAFSAALTAHRYFIPNGG